MTRQPVYRIESVFAGADWIEGSLKRDLSPLGRVVADILGATFLGIYHLDTRALRRVRWDDNLLVEVTIRKELATYDGSELTRLVVLCHDACVRLAIEGVGPGYLRLIFHARVGRDARLGYRHPTIETAVDAVRDGIGRAVSIEEGAATR